MRRTRLLLALLLLAAVACDSPSPVASVAIDRAEVALAHGAWEPVGLAWKMTAPLPELVGEPRVLLHLVAGSGELVRTFDHPFPGGWSVGAERSYEVTLFQSALGAPLALGDYALEVGLYDTAGHRWAVAAGGKVGDGVRVATVRAVEAGAGFPEFSFSADWVPTESGSDRQILARRWLAGDGAIRIRGIESAGSVWMRVGVPSSTKLQEMVLAEGAVQPAATLRAECSGFEAELGGVGSHTLEFSLAPGEASPAECRIAFSANFELISKENGEKRTIALENLAWRAGG